jgi:uncharacterized membrane protein HdeD (DUF308 family)
MLYALATHWWVLLLRGIFALLFGATAFVWPGLALAGLVLLFVSYVWLDGIAALALSFSSGGRPWWRMTQISGVSFLAGLGALFWPGITLFTLLILIALWAIARGILEIAAAIRLRDLMEGEMWLALAGMVSILFGLFLLLRPTAGPLALAWTLGSQGILFGILTIVASLRLRRALGLARRIDMKQVHRTM